VPAPVVLMLEDEAERLDRFRVVAARLGVELVVWRDARRMIAELASHLSSAALISLDHDLIPLHDADPGDGLEVVKHLATLPPVCPVIIHTSNGRGADAMEGELDLAGWTHHRVAPLGDDWIEADWFAVVRRLLRARRG
jgi:CheY-like chemotaxis protein